MPLQERAAEDVTRSSDATCDVHLEATDSLFDHPQRGVKGAVRLELKEESFFIYCGYPSLQDLMFLASFVCERRGLGDWHAAALRIVALTGADPYFAILFAPWVLMNKLQPEALVNGDTAALEKFAWEEVTHLEGGVARPSRRAGGPEFTLSHMVAGIAYGTEPVMAALKRLRSARFVSEQARHTADARELCVRNERARARRADPVVRHLDAHLSLRTHASPRSQFSS